MLIQEEQEPTTDREHRAPSKRTGLQPGTQCNTPQTANGQKRKKIFFKKKTPDAGANSHTARTGGAKPADSGGGGTMLK